jgi:hypothetical protein
MPSNMKYFNVTVIADCSEEELRELLTDYFNGEREYETVEHRYIAPTVTEVNLSIGE